MPEHELTEPERRPNVTATPRPSSAPERKPNVTATPGHRQSNETTTKPKAGTMTSYWLIDLSPGNGTWYQEISLPPGVVNPFTPVFASICETIPGPDGVPIPHAGAATTRINNIVPAEDEVVLQIEVEWKWPLPLQVALAIGPEQGIV